MPLKSARSNANTKEIEIENNNEPCPKTQPTSVYLFVYPFVLPSFRPSVSVLSVVHCLIGIHSHTTLLPSHTLFLLFNQPVKGINFG